MKILCDTNLPLGKTLFGSLGEVTLVDASQIRRDVLKDIDVLIVRGSPNVNADLLEGTPVKFVGVASIGMDNFDVQWLDSHNIKWANAPGANAESVVDYGTAALFEYAHSRHVTLENKTLGIIGMGHIGTLMQKRFEAVGMKVAGFDPYRMADENDEAAKKFLPLDELLATSDIIFVCAPLTDRGEFPTRNLLNQEMISKCKYGSVIVNMARGCLIDTAALCKAVHSGAISDVIIDVWENEPHFSMELAEMAFLATPHLAGLSYEGRVNGMLQIYKDACKFFGKEPTLLPLLPPPAVPKITIDAYGETDEAMLWFLTQRVSMIVADHLRFQEVFDKPEAERNRAFTTLRRTYPYRRQFCATTVIVKHAKPSLIHKIEAIGFKTGTTNEEK